MLYLDPNKEKLLTFEVDVSGDACENIVSHVRLFIEGIELGFPALFKENKIIALIKPLRTFFKIPLKSGTVIESRLDVLSENQDFYSPWQGQIEIKSSFTVEAKLIGDDQVKKTPVDTNSKFTIKSIMEDQFDEIIEKAQPLQEKKKEVKPLPKPVAKAVTKPQPKPQPKKLEPIKEIKTHSLSVDTLKKITKEGVLEYMARAGSKNPQIQEIIYEQATSKAGSGEPFKILKEVVKILNRKSDMSQNGVDIKTMEKIMSGRHGLNNQD